MKQHKFSKITVFVDCKIKYMFRDLNDYDSAAQNVHISQKS